MDREAARQAAERLAAESAELRAAKGELGAAQRRAAELEHRSKRDEVLSHMESQHLRAAETPSIASPPLERERSLSIVKKDESGHRHGTGRRGLSSDPSRMRTPMPRGWAP